MELTDRVETVSPEIRLRFEEFVSRICDEGKVEARERPCKIREWTNRLERLFRENIADGRATDEEGADSAIEAFGSVENISKTLRGGLRGLWHRLLYYSNYSTHRLIAPVAFTIYYCYVRTISSLEVIVDAGGAIQNKVVLFGSTYFIGFRVLVTIVACHWLGRKVRIPKQIFQTLALVVTLWLFTDMGTMWIESVGNFWGRWVASSKFDSLVSIQNSLLVICVLVALAIEAPCLFFITALLTAEIFDWPGRRQARIKAKKDGKTA